MRENSCIIRVAMTLFIYQTRVMGYPQSGNQIHGN